MVKVFVSTSGRNKIEKFIVDMANKGMLGQWLSEEEREGHNSADLLSFLNNYYNPFFLFEFGVECQNFGYHCMTAKLAEATVDDQKRYHLNPGDYVVTEQIVDRWIDDEKSEMNHTKYYKK